MPPLPHTPQARRFSASRRNLFYHDNSYRQSKMPFSYFRVGSRYYIEVRTTATRLYLYILMRARESLIR